MKLKSSNLLLVLIIPLMIACTQDVPQTLPESGIQTCRLSDGRILSYADYGNAMGKPVFYFHGFPGSHQDIHLFGGAEIAEQLNIRLISVNRPGYGDSHGNQGRSLLDWPKDVTELAGHLELDSFSVLGYSGGGPFALACAFAMPERIIRIAVVSGMGPWDAPESRKGMAMTIPKAPKLILNGMIKTLEKKPEKIESNMKKNMPEADRLILEDQQISDAFMKTIRVGLKNGSDGALQDARIYKGEWGFELNQITQPIQLWHGVEDLNVKVETGQYVASQLPQCNPHFLADEGHVTLIFNHIDEIFHSLIKP